MTKVKHSVLTATAALVFAACVGNASATDANAAETAAKMTPAAPAKDALVALEKSAYEAWKSRDTRFWDTFLSDKFVGYGSSGKLDKASATKEYAGADCEIKSYALSDEQVRPLGNDAALLTHKTTVDGTCGGQKVPADSWAATIFVRDRDTWKGAFHAEAPIVDPKAASAVPVVKNEAPNKDEAKPAAPDAGTDALVTNEKAVWEAWKEHDAKKIEHLTARDISFIDIFGNHFANKADAIKDWTGPGCNVKSVSITDGVGTMLSPTVGILRYTGSADGTCFGQKVGSVWGTSVYVKDGDAWKWAFGINLPARR
ncbi:MAG: nuclear transport factor 2 family protein [Rhodanobacteraceae bacterium]